MLGPHICFERSCLINAQGRDVDSLGMFRSALLWEGEGAGEVDERGQGGGAQVEGRLSGPLTRVPASTTFSGSLFQSRMVFGRKAA